MAETQEESDLLINIEATPPKFNRRSKSGAGTILEVFEFTQGVAAGDANSTIRVCKLPAGARYISHLSRIRHSAFGTSRVLSFGWEAYLKPDGTTQAASLTGLGTALDVAAAGTKVLNDATGALESRVFEGPAVLTFQCTGGTIPAGATVKGVIAYTLGSPSA
jgi:hypothetical protein